jgi:hypothetical protein
MPAEPWIGSLVVVDTRRYVRHPSTLSRRVLDGVMLLPRQSNGAWHISQPGDLIWQFLAEPRSFIEICEYVADQHDIAIERVSPDIRQVLDHLDELGSIRTA